MSDKTILVFGVDGMSQGLMDQMRDDNETHMPNFEDLEQDAEYGRFESYTCEGARVPHTGPCWTSIYTGVTPQVHGLVSGGWTEGDSQFHNMYTIWDRLSEEDVSMALYGMPMTYRAKQINGWMVSGFVATPLQSLFHHCLYPKTLSDELPEDFIEYTATFAAKRTIGGAAPKTDNQKGFNGLWDAEKRRLEAFRNLMEEKDTPDVVAYGTTFVDKMGHIAGVEFGQSWTMESYKKVDWMLGELMDIVDPDEVIVISDHGFGMDRKFDHDMNGYYASTVGSMEDLFDFAPLMLSQFGLDYEDGKYGRKEGGEEISEEEKNAIQDQLRNLGYLD